MAENKTKATKKSVIAFLNSIEDIKKREDSTVIVTMIQKITRLKPVMWGSAIIGFGSIHYKYESGREGDMARIGFSPRKGQTVVYLIDGYGDRAVQLARLGRHKVGKSCLYIKRLSDIDVTVLEEMVVGSLAYMAKKYPPAS